MGNHQTLAPQRKDLDAAHAAAHGIRIPRIFPTFDEGKDFVFKEGGALIMRSEHPLELRGLSGLNKSPIVFLARVEQHEERGGLFASYRDMDVDTFLHLIREEHRTKSGWWNAKNYCDHNGINVDEYVKELVYSYWEYIRGTNLYVVADPHVAGRYRVFAKWHDGAESYNACMLYDGTALVTATGDTPKHLESRIDDILRFYDRVREVFGKKMCWVVEMQLADSGELYFLQRSIGKEFKAPDWSFDADGPAHFLVGPRYGYGEVRGITPKEGIDVTFLHERGTRLRWLKGYRPSAMLNAHSDSIVADQSVFDFVKVYINTYHQVHNGIADPHSAILPMVRAPLYLQVPELHERLPDKIKAEAENLEKAKRQDERGWYSKPDKMVNVTINIRSDGREARINVVKVS